MKLTNLFNPLFIYKKRQKIYPYLEYQCEKIHRQFTKRGIIITANNRRLKTLKDCHQGRRCFVIGNGPSLRIEDLDRLKDEITFASNKIYLAFNQTGWRPTYYTIIDDLAAQNNYKEINRLEGFAKIFHVSLKHFLKTSKDTIYVNFHSDESPFSHAPNFSFSIDPIKGLYGGKTVTYMNLQLAAYMGIREIYLIGVDFDYKLTQRYADDKKTILVSGGERNYFTPDYLKPGEIWHLPKFDLMETAFKTAKAVFGENNGIIYNATRGGKLEIFPRVDFEAVVKGK